MLSPIIEQAQPIDIQVFADLLEESEVLESADSGRALVHKCVHPERGDIWLVSQFSGDFGIVQKSAIH